MYPLALWHGASLGGGQMRRHPDMGGSCGYAV
jgi:hypothetical protein